MKDFIVVNTGRKLQEENAVWIIGFFQKDETELYISIDGQHLDLRPDAEERQAIYNAYSNRPHEYYSFEADLPEGWENAKDFHLLSHRAAGEKDTPVFDFLKRPILLSDLRFEFDAARRGEKKDFISGWVVSEEPVDITVSGVEADVRRTHRNDILQFYPELSHDYAAGFEIRLDRPSKEPFTVVFDNGKEQKGYRFTERQYASLAHGRTFAEKVSHYALRTMQVLFDDGPAAVIEKAKKKVAEKTGNGQTYLAWIRQNEPGQGELDAQRKAEKDFAYRPLFSIVVPIYHTKRLFLDDLLKCVEGQTYSNWELCLADAGAENGRSELTEYLSKRAEKDSRILYRALAENAGIAENTNRAIEMAHGDYIVFMDHDDTIALNSLYEITKELNRDRELDVIYSDQDLLDRLVGDQHRLDPLMKPDFDIDFLRCCNYISHLFVVSRRLVDKVGLLDGNYDGSQDYDFTLRCIENTDRICHIPKVLYHWRMASTSTAEDPATKKYAYEAGKRALDAHFKRVGLPATAEITEYYGKYRIHYHWPEQPLLSILIPNKDHIEDLDKCVQSIYEKSSYRNFEFVIVENNSEKEETFAYYEKMEKAHDNFHVVTYEGGFNYSKINNFGEKSCRGDYILLLNNDTEIITEDFFWEMLQYAMRPDVGAVGARLYYKDGTIQHAGVVIGYGRSAGHTFWSAGPTAVGMLGRIVSVQNYSAVTAACLLTKKSVFEEVGGLTEDFAVAFNDIDFCLKIRDKGYLVVYTPFAEAYHYESKSRGYEDTPEKQARFEKEAERLRKRWPVYYEKGDPYYSPNLTLEKADFSLRFDH